MDLEMYGKVAWRPDQSGEEEFERVRKLAVIAFKRYLGLTRISCNAAWLVEVLQYLPNEKTLSVVDWGTFAPPIST